MLSIINFCIKNQNIQFLCKNNVYKLSHKAEICLAMMLHACVHTLFNCVVHLFPWSVGHTCPKGNVMESILIRVALVLKQETLNISMMHSNRGIY